MLPQFIPEFVLIGSQALWFSCDWSKDDQAAMKLTKGLWCSANNPKWKFQKGLSVQILVGRLCSIPSLCASAKTGFWDKGLVIDDLWPSPTQPGRNSNIERWGKSWALITYLPWRREDLASIACLAEEEYARNCGQKWQQNHTHSNITVPPGLQGELSLYLWHM